MTPNDVAARFAQLDVDPIATAWARSRISETLDELVAVELQDAPAGWQSAIEKVRRALIGSPARASVARFDRRTPQIIAAARRRR